MKGIYLEAEISGIPIRWIVPHSFTQFMPDDVDYRVMTTFFEFYETLLHFVLFKLCNDLGVRYPLPAADSEGEVRGSTSFILGANLRSLKNALMSKSNGAIINVVSESVREDGGTPVGEKKSKREKKKSKELINTVEVALNSVKESDDDRLIVIVSVTLEVTVPGESKKSCLDVRYHYENYLQVLHDISVVVEKSSES